MDHHTTMVIAEQRRSDLLADAALVHVRRRATAWPRSLRARLTRRPPA